MRRYAFNLAALALLVVGVSGQASGVVARSSVARCKGPTAQPPHPGSRDTLGGVAATGCKVWVVGGYMSTTQQRSPTLIEYWNGKIWTIQKSPNRGSGDDLSSVAATSASNAWAVGGYYSGTTHREVTLVEHWNGKAWRIQKSPNLASGDNYLSGVAATSASNAWAVGGYYNGTIHRGVTLVEHWNGKAWRIQKSPNLGSGVNGLNGVAASSPANAWAVGESRRGTLVEHWDGKAWRIQKSPNLGSGSNVLNGVAASSPANAWAVGEANYNPLVERWNGKVWKVQKNPRSNGSLSGVAATSASNAWAVGYGPGGTLVEYWNGKAWKVQKSPNPVPSDASISLNGVAASSPANAWAVGTAQCEHSCRVSQSFVLRWNGTTWRP